MNEIRENKMGTMPVNRLLLTMAFPMVISMLVQALYNIVDSLYVARIDPVHQYEFTAISLAFAAQCLLIAVATGTGVGINALLSRSLGEKDYDKVNRIAANGAFLYAISYVVFLIVGLFCMRPYMSLMTDIPQVIDRGAAYLSICFIFSFGLFGQIYVERLLISTGKTQLSMLTQLVGAIINIVLDPVFIFGLDMGIAGAAVATVLGQIAAMGLGFYLNIKKNHEVKLTLRGFRPDGRLIAGVYAIAIPSIIMQSIGSLMNVFFNRILNGFNTAEMLTGKYAQDVFGAYFKLQSFIFMPVFGLNNGMVPIIAYNYGARKRGRMVGTVRLSIFYAMSYMALGLVIFQLLPEFLLSFFIANGDAVAIGVQAFRRISLSFVFAGFCIVVGSVFQALGKSIFSMFVSIARQVVILVPAAYLLSLTGDVNNVWWSFPIAEVMSVVASGVFFAYLYKTVIKPIPEG